MILRKLSNVPVSINRFAAGVRDVANKTITAIYIPNIATKTEERLLLTSAK